MKLPSLVPAGALLVLFHIQAPGGTISLDFNSLPSAQGWTYLTSGQTESSIFSVDGVALHQNSLGTGLGAGGTAYQHYQLDSVVDPTKPFTIEIRARVLESEILDLGGFAFGATNGSEQFAIFIDTHTIWGDSFATVISTSIDNTIFHNYRLDATPGVGYNFFVDGSLIATRAPDASALNRIFLGDVTSGGNARADVTSFTFEQGSVPEPAGAGLMAVGLATLAAQAWWTKKRRLRTHR